MDENCIKEAKNARLRPKMKEKENSDILERSEKRGERGQKDICRQKFDQAQAKCQCKDGAQRTQ